MIKSFKVTNYLGDSIYMDIRKPEDTGFLITSVSGITFPAAQIGLVDSAYDGAAYSGSKIDKRNIVFTIIFYEENKIVNEKTGETVRLDIEQLRHKCYKYFPLKKELKIEITNDSGTYYISGYVEKNESAVFTKQEGAQISVICPDPYFRSQSPEIVTLSDVIANFQFPVKFEDTQEFGFIKYPRITEINYAGASDTGLTIRVEAKGAIKNFAIHDINKKQYMKILNEKIEKKTNSSGIMDKDILEINTRRGKKSITLIRNGKKYNILQSLDKNSKWLTLETGLNVFSYTADSGRANARVTFEYETSYLGV